MLELSTMSNYPQKHSTEMCEESQEKAAFLPELLALPAAFRPEKNGCCC